MKLNVIAVLSLLVLIKAEPLQSKLEKVIIDILNLVTKLYFWINNS